MKNFFWDNKKFLSNKNWKFYFGDTLIQELQNYFNTENFYENNSINHLPNFKNLVIAVKNELINGSGVAFIEGLDQNLFDEEKLSSIMLEFGKKLGTIIESYGKIYEVIDQGKSYKSESIPVSQTNSATSYHTDSTKIDVIPNFVGLLCVQEAKSGGESLISSAVNAYEYIKQHNPNALEFLHKDLVRDIITPGSTNNLTELKKNKFPIFSVDYALQSFTCRYMRYWIEVGNLKLGKPLDKNELKVLDYLDGVLSSPQHVIKLLMKPGNLIWVNNRTICHNRTKYTSFPDKPRKLLRMWIN